MQIFYDITDSDNVEKQLSFRQEPVLKYGSQRFALDVLFDDVREPFILLHVVNNGNIGRVKIFQKMGLPDKSVMKRRPFRNALYDPFYRQHFVLGQPDDAVLMSAEDRNDPVSFKYVN